MVLSDGSERVCLTKEKPITSEASSLIYMDAILLIVRASRVNIFVRSGAVLVFDGIIRLGF